MKIQKKRGQIFLVLVPHRDTRLELRKYSAAHPAAAFPCAARHGAYTFPWVAPLASLFQALNIEELKHCARMVRQAAAGGKFICKKASSLSFWEKTQLYGLKIEAEGGELSLGREALGGQKAQSLFSPPVLGSLLMPTAAAAGTAARTVEADMEKLPPPPALSFRAAAVANMFWQPLTAKAGGEQSEIIGFKWKIGRLCWLSAAKNNS